MNNFYNSLKLFLESQEQCNVKEGTIVVTGSDIDDLVDNLRIEDVHLTTTQVKDLSHGRRVEVTRNGKREAIGAFRNSKGYEVYLRC